MADINILQLGKFWPVLGGVEKVMYDLTAGLSARGVHCDMLCASAGVPPGKVKVNANASVTICPTIAKFSGTMLSPSMIGEVRRRRDKYDLIHVHHPDPMAALALFLSGYKGKVVLHWHSDIQKSPLLMAMYKPLQSWLIRRADKIIGTTPAYLSASPYLRKVQDKTECIPIGIAPVQPDAQGAAEIRKTYEGKKIVFTMGRLVPYKGYGYLIESAKYLDDSWMILIGGSGPMKDELQSAIDAGGLASKVRLLGRVPDDKVSAYYTACDIFCLSSIMKTEAFGIVQIEAMSLGRPVVATKIPGSGVSWVNEDGVSGVNVEPRDPEALANAFCEITSSQEKYRKYSDGALARFNSLFTSDVMITRQLTCYKKILEAEI